MKCKALPHRPALHRDAPYPGIAYIGFLLAFIGSALLIGDVFVDGYIAPILAAHAPNLLGPSSPLMANPPPLFFLVPGLVWSLGYIVLGIATLLTFPLGALCRAGHAGSSSG